MSERTRRVGSVFGTFMVLVQLAVLRHFLEGAVYAADPFWTLGWTRVSQRMSLLRPGVFAHHALDLYLFVFVTCALAALIGLWRSAVLQLFRARDGRDS